MFDNLSEKIGGILDKLTRRGALSAADVDAALREVRRALLEADVGARRRARLLSIACASAPSASR
jgi:signal recognition particle GTPase